MNVSRVLALGSRFRVVGAVLLILAVAFLLRFAAFDHPLSAHNGEGLRDYFVAKHALVYGEWPIGGYDNGLSSFDNSPAYYYFVILLTALGKTLLGVEVLYILLSCAGILGIFALTRMLFGTRAGIIAAALTALAPRFITEVSEFLWPPYVMPFFVIAAFTLLAYGFEKRYPWLVVAGIIPMAVAVAVHLAALPMLALYGFLAVGILVQKPSPHKTIGALFFGGGALLFALFVPSAFTSEESFYLGTRPESDFSITLTTAVARSFSQIAYTFGVGSTSPLYPIFFASILLLSGWFLASKKVPRKQKTFVLLLGSALMLQIGTTILIDPAGIPRHFAAALWMLPVVFGILISAPFGRSKVFSAIALGFLLIIGYSSFTDVRVVHAVDSIPAFERPHEQVLESAVSAMAKTAVRIKQEQNLPDYSFFKIYALGDTNRVITPYLFWGPLEEKLGTELRQGPDTIVRSRIINPTEDYWFIGCLKYVPSYTSEQCLRDARQQGSGTYELRETVFQSERLSVYLVARFK